MQRRLSMEGPSTGGTAHAHAYPPLPPAPHRLLTPYAPTHAPSKQFTFEDYDEELAGLLAIPDRLQAVQLIRSRYRSTGGKGRSSRYRGVSLHASGRWEARITLGAGAERRYKVGGHPLPTAQPALDRCAAAAALQRVLFPRP